jgi:hypothetical protein
LDKMLRRARLAVSLGPTLPARDASHAAEPLPAPLSLRRLDVVSTDASSAAQNGASASAEILRHRFEVVGA